MDTGKKWWEVTAEELAEAGVDRVVNSKILGAGIVVASFSSIFFLWGWELSKQGGWVIPLFLGFILPGFAVFFIGIFLIDAASKSVDRALKVAEKHWRRKQFISAAYLYHRIAAACQKQEESALARQLFWLAVETHFQSGKYDKFVAFVKLRTKRVLPDPGDQLAFLQRATNKLLGVGEPKKAAQVVTRMGAVYERELQNGEKATYYKELAQQVRAGRVESIT
ncbi:MAG: hypothetical protein HWN66_03510 [Candidatus Helarchaeota archaeon]|nr:hypothetical protein [Candidatus Helarchaeota archaeon]